MKGKSTVHAKEKDKAKTTTIAKLKVRGFYETQKVIDPKTGG